LLLCGQLTAGLASLQASIASQQAASHTYITHIHHPHHHTSNKTLHTCSSTTTINNQQQAKRSKERKATHKILHNKQQEQQQPSCFLIKLTTRPQPQAALQH
jgi:hypothetical protein